LLPLIAAPGCTRGPRNFENENDRLRRLTSQLRDRVDSLSQRVESLKKELAAARRAAAAEGPENVRRPTVRRIELRGYSGGIDTNEDRPDDALRLYLRTLDDRNRFVQALGEVEVTAAVIPPGEEARTVATASFGPKELDDAYRSGFGGAHYTLIVPVDEQKVPPETDELTVRVRFRNLLTDERLNTERTVRWSGPGEDQTAPPPAEQQPADQQQQPQDPQREQPPQQQQDPAPEQQREQPPEEPSPE
jgi:hypothetical protein